MQAIHLCSLHLFYNHAVQFIVYTAFRQPLETISAIFLELFNHFHLSHPTGKRRVKQRENKEGDEGTNTGKVPENKTSQVSNTGLPSLPLQILPAYRPTSHNTAARGTALLALSARRQHGTTLIE